MFICKREFTAEFVEEYLIFEVRIRDLREAIELARVVLGSISSYLISTVRSLKVEYVCS